MSFDTVRILTIVEDELAEETEPRRDFVLAVLKTVDGAVAVPNRPNYVWAADWNQPQSIYMILNKRVPAVAGLQVKIGYPEKPPFIRQVLGTWDDITELSDYTEGSGGALDSGPHAQSHQWPSEAEKGTDPVKIFQPALMPLKTVADGTLAVTMYPLNYSIEGYRRSFTGDTVDLTSYVPSTASRAKYVLVYLDAESNSLEVLEGAEVIDSIAITVPKPLLPGDSVASAYIKLTDATTAIEQADVEDAREFLHINAGEIDVPQSTRPGDIIIAEAAPAWTTGKPVVDDFGGIITDDNGIMVTV